MNQEEMDFIQKSYRYAEEKYQGLFRLNGETLLSHGVEVARILTNLHVDAVTIASAFLHEVMRKCQVTNEEIQEEFGQDVAKIVSSLSKINQLELGDDRKSSALYLRNVLVGMAEDVRVLFLKLADRLHNLRTIDVLDEEKQKQNAKETMEVLVPIAHRLGINSIKSELENLSLKCLKPDVYSDILERLNASSNALQDVLLEMQEEISELLLEQGIEFYIKSRVKSVYSIYNKLNHGKKWSNIYDILALRVIVTKVSDCYTALGLIHAKYRPIPGRFKDYIAMPKENMYQSLHTGVFGREGHPFEVQIRTEEMDEIAEKGIASHWSYKEKGTKNVQNMMEQKLEVFRNILETQKAENDVEFAHAVQNEFLSGFIYVFTPKGDVVELPKGSTPIDFAYRIHSDLGDHLASAIVNDTIVPLNYELGDQDIVSIRTNLNNTPKKEWLNIVKTNHAKNKIKSYFSKQDREFYISKGKEILEKELRKRKLSFDEVLGEKPLKKILQELKLKDLTDVYLAIGALRYTASSIIHLVTQEKPVDDMMLERVKENRLLPKRNDASPFIVAGFEDILVHLANCCHPVCGDDIVGYITKGEGIRVHLKKCPNMVKLRERLIEVNWNYEKEGNYLVEIVVEVELGNYDFSLLMTKATTCGVFIEGMKTKEKDSFFCYELLLRVKNKLELEHFMGVLEMLSFVKDVYRK